MMTEETSQEMEKPLETSVEQTNEKSEETSVEETSVEPSDATSEITSVESAEETSDEISAEVTEEPSVEKSTEIPAEEPIIAVAETIFPVEEKQVELPTLDFASASKDALLGFFDKIKTLSEENQQAGFFKKVDEIIKEGKAAYDAHKNSERSAALASFKASNEDSEEGFSFKSDEIGHQIETILGNLRSTKQNFFQQLEKQKEKALEGKNRLIVELRNLVDSDDHSDPAHVNASFKTFKKIQEEWKSLGNAAGPQNQTLWQSYHALVDRFYSNRSIFFELLELDRKKNLQAKEIIAKKLEGLAAELGKGGVLQKLLKEAEELFEEYKHIGPAQRDENEALWQRVKKSLDVLFEQKRQINEAQKAVFEDNLKIKKELADLMKHHAGFSSTSISEWNQASKSVLALQEQWGKLKGGLPREGGKEVSNAFWSDLKLFFKHKSEFFTKIDAERKANLAAKQQLVDQVNGIVETGTETPEITQMVIDLQKKWKDIGHVPEKQKDQIYAKFKAACDAYFNLKREKGKGSKDAEFDANLVAKQELLVELEAMLKDPSLLATLGEKKAAWDAIGFVPKKEVRNMQEKFRNTWNALIDLARTQPKEQLAAWGFELKSMSTEEKNHSEDRKAPNGDARKKIQALENDIAVLTNNLEFFAKSKNSEKLRLEVEKKIAKAQEDLDKLKKE
ncbi:DUF349 domain-containing protein [Aquirufa sp. ROCK2-A2]